MLFRLPGALARAALVVLLVTLPSLLLRGGTTDGAQIVALVAVFAALFTLVEYSAASPSLVEFRDAPPFNRVRFGALFATVFLVSVIFRGYQAPSPLTVLVRDSAGQIGQFIDFPYSPVRLLSIVVRDDVTERLSLALRDAAGLSYLISIVSVLWFMVVAWLQHWPRRGGAFNVWINLPTFDPTAGGDVVRRLRRDGRINILLGILLPFLLPAIIKLTVLLGAPLQLDDPRTLIWTVTAWAALPAGILMRGIALTRVARMIHLQRKKAYAKAASEGLLPA